jgi:hypothetical protein
MVPSIYCLCLWHCCNLLCLMLVTLGPSAMISDLNLLLFYDNNCCLWSYLQVVYIYVVQNPRPQSDSNWDNMRGWLWCEDHMCSLSVNALLWYSIKRSTLITSSFPWGPAANGLVGQKMSCKFLIASTHDYIQNTCLWLFSTRILYLYLSAIAHVIDYYMNCLVHATPVHPSLCLQYLILIFTIDTVTVFTLLLLLLFYYCHHYKTVATDKPLRASLFPGAAEFTTHLWRLINILWLPLCQINKFGFYFPRRLLRSPILVGHCNIPKFTFGHLHFIHLHIIYSKLFLSKNFTFENPP